MHSLHPNRLQPDGLPSGHPPPDSTQLLQLARQRGASDLHLSSGQVPMLRIDGHLQPLPLPVATDDDLSRWLRPWVDETAWQQLQAGHEVDATWQAPADIADPQPPARYRLNLFRHRGGLAAAVRLIPQHIPSLQALHAPPVMARLCQQAQGLVLVGGATGSGKSTLLAALLAHLRAQQAPHVITLEDPVEFVHGDGPGLVQQREIGRDSPGFASALRAALREDPDVILIGELRDLETIRLALTAAETGHLVLASLHASSTARAVERIVDVFPGEEKALVRTQLADSLAAIVTQVLCPHASGQGRVAAHEVLVATPAVRNQIREGRGAQLASTLQTGAEAGMQTLAQGLAQRVQQGLITAATARLATTALRG